MFRILVGLLLLTLVTSFHVLKHFDQDIANIKHHYKIGDTSRVFSILMKMFYHTKTLANELKIPHPKIQTTFENKNCTTML